MYNATPKGRQRHRQSEQSLCNITQTICLAIHWTATRGGRRSVCMFNIGSRKPRIVSWLGRWVTAMLHHWTRQLKRGRLFHAPPVSLRRFCKPLRKLESAAHLGWGNCAITMKIKHKICKEYDVRHSKHNRKGWVERL